MRTHFTAVFRFLILIFCIICSLDSFSGNCISRSDSLIINRQTQLDSFPIIYSGCDRIIGKLIISGSTISSLQSLSSLKYIETLVIKENPLLVSLHGLGNLQTAGNIEISNNFSLLSLNGLEELDSVQTTLEIKYNPSLITLDGLNSLKKVKNTLSIFINESLSNLDGLEAIESIYRLSIYGNTILGSLLGLDSNINLKIIDIWVNEELKCCNVVKKIKINNPSISLNNIFSNNVGCSNSSEIMNSSGIEICCKTEFSVNNASICDGQSIQIGNNIYNSPGIYIDSLISVSGCDSVLYTNLRSGQPSFSVIYRTLCSGQGFRLSNGREIYSDGSYLDTIPFTCDSIIEYKLNFIENTVVNRQISVCAGQKFTLPSGRIVDVDGIYMDTLSTTGVCDSVFKYTINYFPNTFTASLTTQVSLDAGDSLQLKPEYNNGVPIGWIWQQNVDLSCIDCEQPIVKPKENSYYQVIVQADNGCEDTAGTFILLNKPNIYIPDAFSPNNDGVNDDFSVFIASPKTFLLKIYNRYGELVFQTNDISVKWNGIYKNMPCPLDTYIYQLEINSFNNERIEKKGTVLLLR